MTSDSDSTPTLWAEHVELLRKRGIPEDLALKYGLRSVSAGQIKGLRLSEGRGTYPGLPGYDTSGILIPYAKCQDGIPRCRIRADRTEYVANEEPVPGVHAAGDLVKIPRYIAQAQLGVVPYIATAMRYSEDVSRNIFVAEAPLKALSLRAHGFVAVGLGGVLAGAHDRAALHDLEEVTAHPELRRINWQRRRTYVVFDAGMTENPLVALGAARTAHVLRGLGADVLIITLPFLREDINLETGLMYTRTDQGPDDFLARNGIEAFNQLVELAVPACPVTRIQIAVGDLPRGDHGARVAAASRVGGLLTDLPFQALLRVAGPAEQAGCAAVTERLKIGIGAYRTAAREFDQRIRQRVEEQAGDTSYCVRDGAFFTGERRLTNFTAKVVEEILRDAGDHQARVFRIEGELASGAKLPALTVDASEFSEMAWVVERWGANAVVEAGRGVADHARAAIQTLSSPTSRVVYTGYGWREIEGRQVYLVPGPHVPEGVEIEHDIRGYHLDGDGDVAQAYQAILALHDVAPPEVVVPLIGAAFIAPFSMALELDFAFWLSGRSGTRKSSLAALILSFFGTFTLTSLPLNFQGTVTYLEARLHELRDVLTVVDNYIPPQTGKDLQDQTSKAVRTVQAIGDRASRGRCSRDASVRPSRDPQGLVIFTGERLPAENESTLGRLLVISITENTINLDSLSEAQASADMLRVAMRAMIERAGADLAGCVRRLRDRRDDLARALRQRLPEAHGRTPGALAAALAGYELMVAHAVAVGAATEEAAESARFSAFQAVLQVGKSQPKIESVGPAGWYLTAVRAMVAQGTRVLVGEHEPLNTTKTVGQHDVEVKNGIGWKTQEHAYLHPELSWHAVKEFWKDNLQYTKTDCHRDLAERGLLLDRDTEKGGERYTSRRSVGGTRERVLVLALDQILEADPSSGPALAEVISIEDYLDGSGSV
ncbi:MAG: DUF3854 domain-containing protein [Myxococcales bacterium]|nr:DUF3854 domain-containing protein [Myxococcales bacterium]